MKYIFKILLVILLSGCATAHKISNVQLGMSKEDVIAAIGKPVSMSVKGETEYLNYRFSETSDDAYYGVSDPYYVRLVNGKVDSFGRTGDFDSTQKQTIRIETDDNTDKHDGTALYAELRMLKNLRDEGVLTESEYQDQKQRVLNK